MADEPTEEQVRIVATAIAKAYEESCIVAECDMVAARAAIEAWLSTLPEPFRFEFSRAYWDAIQQPLPPSTEGIPVYRLTGEDPT